MVLDIIYSQSTGNELVFVWRGSAFHHCALKICVTSDDDIKSFSSRFDTTLLINTRVIAVTFLFAIANAAASNTSSDGYADAYTSVALFSLAGRGILHTFNVKISRNIGNHSFSANIGTY